MPRTDGRAPSEADHRPAGPRSIGDQAIGACVVRACSPLSDPAKLASTASLAILERMNPAENNQETTRPGGITGHGFKPGQSGNPGGRPKGVARTVREVCGGSPLRLAQGLLEIAEDPKARDRDRVAAIRELLDRGWGKAPEYAAMEVARSARTFRHRARGPSDRGRASSEARSKGVAPLSVEAAVCRAKWREPRDWLGSRLGLAVGCCHSESLWGGRYPQCKAVWRPVTVRDRSRIVLAMQKVEGSSPFIRSHKSPRESGDFCLKGRQRELRRETPLSGCTCRVGSRCGCDSAARSPARRRDVHRHGRLHGADPGGRASGRRQARRGTCAALDRQPRRVRRDDRPAARRREHEHVPELARGGRRPRSRSSRSSRRRTFRFASASTSAR